MTLNQKDVIGIDASIKVIRHIQDDDSPRRIGMVQVLELLAFILAGAKELLIRKDGKPKTTAQILISIIPIIKFIIEAVRRINEVMNSKPKALQGMNSTYKPGQTGVSSK